MFLNVLFKCSQVPVPVHLLQGQHIAQQKSTPQKSSWIFSCIFQWMFSGIFQRNFTFQLYVNNNCPLVAQHHVLFFWRLEARNDARTVTALMGIWLQVHQSACHLILIILLTPIILLTHIYIYII